MDREQGLDRSDSEDFQCRGKAEDWEQGRTRSNFEEVRCWRGKPGYEGELWLVLPPNIVCEAKLRVCLLQDEGDLIGLPSDLLDHQ